MFIKQQKKDEREKVIACKVGIFLGEREREREREKERERDKRTKMFPGIK